MKTFYKVLGIVIVLLIAVALVLPFVFQNKITRLAKEEINKNLNATVDFGSIRLSMFRNFPNFTLGMSDLTIVGTEKFQGDTLAFIPGLDITVDLMSVFRGDYTVRKINIDSPAIAMKILKDGTANYDIIPEGEETTAAPETTPETGEPFRLQLNQLQIKDGILVYDDQSSSMNFSAFGISFLLSGDLGADRTKLRTNTVLEKMNLVYDGIPYFSGTRVEYEAGIDADLTNEIYTLEKNSLVLNALKIVFEGSLSMVNDDMQIMMTFDTPSTDFKHILSLVPAIYQKDFDGLNASGRLRVNGHIKGLYTEENLPAFQINTEIVDGMFQYPDLPSSVTGVNVLASVANRGGDADNTVIDVSKINLKLGQNPLEAKMVIKTPVSDPDLDGAIKGKLDLGTIKDFYPMEESENLSGSVVADVILKGRLSAVENEEYESFTALGSVLMQQIEYNSSYTKEPVLISTAQLNFSPEYLDLVSLKTNIGNNDIAAKGKINNYLSYLFGDGTLTGNFTTQSEYMNLNDLLSEDEDASTGTETASDATVMEVFEVPEKIDFALTSSFGNLVYDVYDMRNVNGRITIRERKVNLDNLSMNILDGEMSVNGSYSTVDPEKPMFDFDLDLKSIDIQQAYATFGILPKYAPIAKKTEGTFSTRLTMSSLLNKQMEPVYETMTGGGTLETSALKVRDVNTLEKIANALKYQEFKDLALKPIILMFDFVDGKILVEPFDFSGSDYSGTMAGWTGLDQSIEYTMNLNIPWNSLGKDANDAMNKLVDQANAKGASISLGSDVSLDVLIGGTLTNPEIRTKLKEQGKNLVEDVKKQVEDEIRKKKEELSKEAKQEAQKILNEANTQAKRILEEAEKQATNLREGAADAAKQVRDEADKQAKKVEDEGKKKGFLAEAAAKETGKQIRKEGDKQAKNIEDEADKKAKALMEKARKEADQIRIKAQEEASNILEKAESK
jgi:hypothetical protein